MVYSCLRNHLYIYIYIYQLNLSILPVAWIDIICSSFFSLDFEPKQFRSPNDDPGDPLAPESGCKRRIPRILTGH